MARQRKVKGPPGGFAGIPRIVIEHPDFRGVSSTAKVVLLMLAYQYRGGNNGDLSAAPSLLKGWGIASKVTVLIIRTREGRFMNPGGRCALYALSWQPIDECQGKHDAQPTTTPPRKFTLERRP